MSRAPSAADVARRRDESNDDTLRTEFPFELPYGYVDDEQVHKTGVMRLATARDEILPLRDPRVRDNEAYLTIILLARVVTELGTLSSINPGVIEGLFAADLAFLQDLYRRVNQEGHTRAAVECPACRHEFAVDVAGGRPGES
jgi:hypothetical protein